MPLPPTLAARLKGMGLVFLCLALASIALTLWVTWQLEGGAAAVNEAGRLRMMTYRLALATAGGEDAAIGPRVRAMDATIELLAAGDPARPLFVPWNEPAREDFRAVRDEWARQRAQWLAPGTGMRTGEADRLVAGVERFVSRIESRLSHWTDVLRAFQFTMVAFAIGSTVLLLYAAQLMVLDPLSRLGAAIDAIRGGDLSVRVDATTEDEFGRLAAGFNAMAGRLQALYGDLEAKVREKTARLEAKRERLAALYEVSAFVAQAESLNQLGRGFVGMLRRIARADAAAVRWSDERNRHFLLLAQEGLPPGMAGAEQCLPSEQCHCGQGKAPAGTRVIPIRAADTGLGHCQRAGFKTLVTVPITLHHQVLGEVDLFFRAEHELDAEDRSLVETLASHLAGGIESLRAAAADREAAVAAERSLLARELHDSIAQSLAFLKIQVVLLRIAAARGNETALHKTLDEIDTGVRECYADVRELLLHFRTRTDEQDIEAALRATIQKFEQQTGLPVQLRIEGHGVPLPADVQVQVLHVVQEALSNVRKHAGASSVRVAVQQSPQWRIEVSDDGRGFDTAASPGADHVGLQIMQERARRIDATVSVVSQPGKGTRVAITVPVEAVAQEAAA